MGLHDATDRTAKRLYIGPLTVVVHRRVRPGHEVEFESILHDFLPFAVANPGQLGMHVLRPGSGSRDYTIVAQFADEESHSGFRRSSEYRQWFDRVQQITEGDPRINERTGLETWVTLPEIPHAAPPPKSKMAVMSFLGVYPTTAFLAVMLSPMTDGWHRLLRHALLVGCAAIVLTWLVMPGLTRLMQRWLYPEEIA